MKKELTILILMLVLMFFGTLASQAQTLRRLKVYMKSGVVDKVLLDSHSSVRHSRTDLNGRVQSDYVTMVVTDSEGRERQYLISQLDSLVLPNGQHVVFHGSTHDQPVYAPAANGWTPVPPLSASRRSSFSGTFPGAGTGNVTFYWTYNDHIRLDVGDESRAEQLTTDNTGASFVFDDAELDAMSYLVYFPDSVVTIPSVQTQTGADNTEHIGRSGDCGMALATRTADDTYEFTLQHKASYLCFLPHIDYLPSAKIVRIELSCNEPIAGTFHLSENGLHDGTDTSKKISLELNGRKPQDFFIGHDFHTDQDSCAAYMVIAPQDGLRSFTATYYVTDTLSRVTHTHVQTFSLQPKANTVYPVTCNIPESLFRSVDLGFEHVWSSVNQGSELPNEPGDYFTWDSSMAGMTDSWGMPSENAVNELLDKCVWTWGSYNGTDGWLVEGTNNGNDDVSKPRIFLPVVGFKEGNTPHQRNGGYYWLDMGGDSGGTQQYALTFDSESRETALMNSRLALNTRMVKSVNRSFNIPSHGTQYVDLRSHGPGYSIKVYDHAGPSGNYSNNIGGYLQITCAEGYKLNISGTVNTESNCDPIRCYDVTETGDVQFGIASGEGISINATSRTNVVKLYFSSDGSRVNSGLDLTVTIQRIKTIYHVQVADVVGGSLSIQHSTDSEQHSLAHPEDSIWLTAHPNPGYVLHHIEVKAEGTVLTLYEDDPRLFQNAASAARHYLMCDTVRVRDGNWWHDDSHFLMPYSNVTVTPVFTSSDEDLWLNMAGNDTTKVERKYLQRLLDCGMTKFRFYDYNGKNGNYNDNNVNGYMLVDAPVGYIMSIAGQVWTEASCDPLNIYDGPHTGYQLLVSAGGTTSFSTTTHNNVAFMYFHTDGSKVGYQGYDCTVTLQEDQVTQFNIPYNTVLDLTEEHMTWVLNRGITSMKVYDHGGPDANYGNNCNGSLRFHLPTGWHARIHGTSSSEGCDYFYVYDNEQQICQVSGVNQTIDCTTVSNVFRLYFHSDGSVVYAGQDLTVDFIKPEFDVSLTQ